MHSISAHLIRREELRGDKIDSLTNKKEYNLDFIELDANVLAFFGKEKDILKFGADKTYVWIETDYFGGIGDQNAILFENNKKTKFNPETPINDALKKIGVIRKDGMDEFDTIGLGRYRTNKDFMKVLKNG